MDKKVCLRDVLLAAMPPNVLVTRDELIRTIFGQIDEAIAHLVGTGAVDFIPDRLGEPHLDHFRRPGLPVVPPLSTPPA